ncbi:MAG: N-acetyl-alpha-D-glucosaminyl L-malate synthase BshA [Candidatus Hydrogenedens sp.]|nr:N-acetyl-alpha-D-glucosaminyl L-malate synthase BshA [Candidatus Hydrogenedens sp.]
MKIGISCHATAGGSGVLATELGIALAGRGHQVHIVSDEMPFRLRSFHENLYSHSVDAMSYPLFRTPPYTLALANKIAEVAIEHDIDIFHAHYAIPNAVAALLARDMMPAGKDFALVTTLHGTDITLVGSDPSFYRITKYSMQKSCVVTAVSQWLADETYQEFNIDKPIQVIHNFIDPEQFNGKSMRRCQFASEGEKIVMHISNFRPVKRVTDVVRAFKKILDHVDAKLVMVGEGPERMASLRTAKQLGIDDRVRYIGVHEDIEAILPCADLVFQPSEHESFGLVALEAMACGVPVLATDSGGVREVIHHGVHGYLTEVGDIEAMAACAIDILTDPAKAKAMGAAGREFALANFSRDTIVSQYEMLYDRVVEARNALAC